jgi:lipopolysaccharide/colanic/teichoic acid biosynthesis glycosyltransferase
VLNRSFPRWAVLAAPPVVVVLLAELHAYYVGHYSFTGTARFGWVIGYILLLELTAYLAGVPDVSDAQWGATWSAFGASIGGAAAFSLIQLAGGTLLLPRIVVLGAAVVLFPIYLAFTVVARGAERSGTGDDRILAVVSADDAVTLEADLAHDAERPAKLAGVVDTSTVSRPLGGTLGGLVRAVEECGATVLVLGRDAQGDESVVAQAAMLHASGVRVRPLATFYDEWLGKLPLSELERSSLFFDIQELHVPRYARIKRLVDLVSGLVGVIILVPACALVLLLDLAGNRGPLFFRQPRVGKGGREFTIVKFRTMPVDLNESGWTTMEDPRLGVVGRWMRRMHLDEIPQAINILRGELSLVGPRPEQPKYVAELREKIPFYEVRHLVNPGLTGWAQVKFGYGATIHDALEKLQYEFFYLRHQGPMLDARIIARTFRSMIRLEGR